MSKLVYAVVIRKLPRRLQSTMLPASRHAVSLHMKINPVCKAAVIIVSYTGKAERYSMQDGISRGAGILQAQPANPRKDENGGKHD